MASYTEFRSETLESLIEVLPQRTVRALSVLRQVDEDVRLHAIAALPLGSLSALAAFEAIAFEDPSGEQPEVRLLDLGRQLIEAAGEFYPDEHLSLEAEALANRVRGLDRVLKNLPELAGA